MKPNGESNPVVSPDLDLLPNQIENAPQTEQTKSLALPDAWRDEQHQGLLNQQTLKKAVTVIRTKAKTRQLMALCKGVAGAQKSDDWSVKYERLLRSPVWKLVSDEAIRKAEFKCECFGCSGRAQQVHLLEFPEAHLEPNFDWMNRNSILIAVCSHHFEIVHQLLLKKVVPENGDLTPECDSASPAVLAVQ